MTKAVLNEYLKKGNRLSVASKSCRPVEDPVVVKVKGFIAPEVIFPVCPVVTETNIEHLLVKKINPVY
jgi:hypothetical protein